MGNRKSSGMKLVPVSPSACDTSLSDAEEPMPARSSEVEVRNLGEFMLKKMKKFEKNVAMVDGVTSQVYTYDELISEVEKLACALQSAGVQPGHVICILTPNRLEYPILYYAVTLIGAVFQPLSPFYTADELEKMFRQCDTQMVFTEMALTEKIKELDLELKVYVFDGEENSPYPTYKGLLQKSGDKRTTKGPNINPRTNPAVLLCTSGTTGLPKAAQLSHFGVVSASIHISEIYRTEDGKKALIPPGDSVLVFVPLCHVFGLNCILNASLIMGLKIVMMSRFNPENFLVLLQEYKVSLTHIVPPIALFLLKNPLVQQYDLTGLKSIVCGAAPLQSGLDQQLRDKMAPAVILPGYGMTELTVSHANTPQYNKPGSCGKLLPGMQYKIVDSVTRETLGPNQSGELCIRGDHVMLGYVNQNEATEQAFDGEGWLLTGDIAKVDEDGFMFIVGRLKELIKYKGLQVPPALLEDILLQHPGVGDAAVLGLPDVEAGELPRAFIVRKPGTHVEAKDIHALINVCMCQFIQPTNTQTGGFCMPGFEQHQKSCYRFMNIQATWADAWTYCKTLGSHPTSIETADENTFLTGLIVRHITNYTGSGDMRQRIWTDGNNFLGLHHWAGSRAPISFTAWHPGEPYLSTPDAVFCILKMGAYWYADNCSHQRSFVCEIEMDGMVMPIITQSTTKPDKVAIG